MIHGTRPSSGMRASRTLRNMLMASLPCPGGALDTGTLMPVRHPGRVRVRDGGRARSRGCYRGLFMMRS